MATVNKFKSLEELVKGLAGKLGELSLGKAAIDDVDEMCHDARELYERLVVLRHRGREAMLEGKSSFEIPESKPEPDTNPPADPGNNQADQAPVMQLDLSADIGNSGQTDLLDAIAQEESAPESLEEVNRTSEEKESNPTISESDDQQSVAETAANSTIADLNESIGLNQKFMFISQVFNGKKSDYALAIDKLNAMDNATEAMNYGKELTAHLNDEADEGEAKTQFLDLIERRYS